MCWKVEVQDTPKSQNVSAGAKKHNPNRRIHKPTTTCWGWPLIQPGLGYENSFFLTVEDSQWAVRHYHIIFSDVNIFMEIMYVNTYLQTNRYKATFPLPSSPTDSPTAWQIFQEFFHYTVGKSRGAARSGHCRWREEGAYSLTHGY